jgi:hypothetical protein
MKRVSFRAAAAAASLLCLLAGCGDGDRTVPVDDNPPPVIPETIQGIATPSSVSVVTATNAD